MGSRWRQLLQLRRGFRAVFRLSPACCRVPRPVKFLHASSVNCRFLGSGNGPAGGRPDKDGGEWGTGEGEEDSEEEGEEDEEFEVEDEELRESALPPLPLGVQHVFVVHPAVKWGPGKARLTTAELQLAEAVALINTIQDWTVVEKMILSTKNADKLFIFGKGNLQLLTDKIKELPCVSAVFVNVERLSLRTKKEFEQAWGVEVFDRYSVVLHIFRRNAQTKEAKLQISLAEIPILRTNLRNEVAQMDQQRGGSRYIMGSGETFMEVQLRLLKEKEAKIRRALERLRRKRSLLRKQRKKCEFPIISVMGYTNCGKTTLIKALTGDLGLEPQDRLFATLDITAHAGCLPSRLTVLFVDTIGFLTQLPHDLIESFSATLEDVACSDLIVHVRDISHPETTLQKESVLSVLRNLHLPSQLMESIIEVHNKVDLVDSYHPTEPNAIAISALLGHGLDNLKEEIERTVLKITGRQILTIQVDLSGPQLSWLYKEATVQEMNVNPEDSTATVNVIISSSALGRYKRLFPRSRCSSMGKGNPD
ncbi:putative GTP-binding protein 6 isoform X2 [Sphaerodactylus townsendi]|uniref:putative GTP-binding protein 6 isoform X2 n=1 Tax=Sphaerodactylus townsendi TaxID=933632 RepID=UPI002026B8D8|nr:putative GTP-binding protein 6 isoform X2 [Sphaerodactylus townsendi]